MADPIEYLLESIVKPEFDVTMLMVIIVGMVLFVLWIITNFFDNKRLQTVLFDVHEKINIFIENKRIKTV
jgi:hypothetical protein